jgi:5-formyltetrahydrofolate cyclo-ligase
VRRDAVTIGIAPEAVIVERLPMEGHDRVLSHLASEGGILAFRAQQ